MNAVTGLRLKRLTTAVGAVIEGVDLRKPISGEAMRFIRQALGEHGVVFFRNQALDAESLWAFAENFGKPHKEEATGTDQDRPSDVVEADMRMAKSSTAVWHSDTTFLARPPKATLMRAIRPPEFGGDTCWSSMYAAYDALSEPMRAMLDKLSAVHSLGRFMARTGAFGVHYAQTMGANHPPERVHPVIQIHPETGRKALYVNEAWTTRILELGPGESDAILGFLFEHVKSPDFNMRWRWEPDDLAFWDNCAVQHYAVPDYTSERVMQRIVLAGDEPRGPN
jgi:taurine dioxygenase